MRTPPRSRYAMVFPSSAGLACLHLTERYVLADIRFAWHAEYPLSDDVALDLIRPAGDRYARHRDQDLRDDSAEHRTRPGQHAGCSRDHRVHARCLPGDL